MSDISFSHRVDSSLDVSLDMLNQAAKRKIQTGRSELHVPTTPS